MAFTGCLNFLLSENKQKIPLTISCIFTPALAASLNFSINTWSEREFIFNRIPADFFFFAVLISWLISLSNSRRRLIGQGIRVLQPLRTSGRDLFFSRKRNTL